jgi:Cu/Ag efflux protein CusF
MRVASSEDDMERNTRTTLGVSAFALMLAASLAAAQAPQTMRLRGVIEKVDGRTVLAKSDKGDQLKLNLADKTLVVEVVKASMADIKDGSFIGSGAMPQADGSQKAIEVHIFAESMRGTGEGFRPWDGAPNSTMTNGTVGNTVTGVDGPVITVKYRDGEKKIIVAPDVPIVRYEIGGVNAVKPGAAFSVLRAVKKPDGSFDIDRINVGRDGVVPR